MVHGHRALGQGVDVVTFGSRTVAIVPDRQRRHGVDDPLAQMVRGLPFPAAFGGKLEAAQRFDVEREEIGLRRIVERVLHGPVLIVAVPRLEIGGFLRNVRDEEAAVFDIAIQLVRVCVTAARLPARRAAIAKERAHAGAAHVIGDVVSVVGVFLAAVVVDESRQAQLCAKLAKDRLKAAHVAVRLNHRPADRVGRGIRFANGPVEKRYAVVPFQISGIRQDQVRVGDHFGAIGIRIDDAGDDVVAVFVLVRQHLHHAADIHGGVPRHVGHVHEQRVDLVGIARVGVGNHHMHQPVARHGVFPCERLVDAGGAAVFVEG